MTGRREERGREGRREREGRKGSVISPSGNSSVVHSHALCTLMDLVLAEPIAAFLALQNYSAVSLLDSLRLSAVTVRMRVVVALSSREVAGRVDGPLTWDQLRSELLFRAEIHVRLMEPVLETITCSWSMSSRTSGRMSPAAVREKQEEVTGDGGRMW